MTGNYEQPLSPNFEKGTVLPPEVKKFDGGIFVAYFYPGLQVIIKNLSDTPHSEKSIKQFLMEYDEAQGINPVDMNSLTSKITEGQTNLQKTKMPKTGATERIVHGKVEPVIKVLKSGGVLQEVAHALDMAGITNQELAQRNIPEYKRKLYIALLRGSKMHGLRNIRFERNDAGKITAVMDSVGILYPFYRYIRDPELSRDMLNLANPTGTAIILETGDHKFVLQYRKPFDPVTNTGNVMHGGIAGASAAGMWKQEVEHPETNARQEMHEELGLHVDPGADPNGFIIEQAKNITANELHLKFNDIDSMAVTGLSGDLSAVHAEVLLYGKLNIDSATLEQRSLHARTYVNDPQYDFEESFVTIPATSEAVRKLLTEFKNPLPANHLAAYTAAGLAKKKEELAHDFPDVSRADRERRLDKWYSELEEGIRMNYEDIDRRAGGRYDFGHTPSAQKNPIPSFHEEVLKVFGINFAEEKAAAVENLRQPTNAYLLDIDGVLSDPKKKEIVLPQILEEIINRLRRGEPVGLNTGRSLASIEKIVLDPLKKMIRRKKLDDSILHNLIAIGEKGGAWATFDKAGEVMERYRDNKLAVPKYLRGLVGKYVAENFTTMFYDKTKTTMISVEMKDDLPSTQEATFNMEKQRLATYLHNLLNDLGFINKYSVDVTRIAVDLQYADGKLKAGKGRGTDVFIRILSERGIKPKRYVSAGDSTSDAEMHKRLKELELASHFVYVGGRKDLAKENFAEDEVTYSEDNGYSLDKGMCWFMV